MKEILNFLQYYFLPGVWFYQAVNLAAYAIKFEPFSTAGTICYLGGGFMFAVAIYLYKRIPNE